jgi:hypothetical protein
VLSWVTADLGRPPRPQFRGQASAFSPCEPLTPSAASARKASALPRDLDEGWRARGLPKRIRERSGIAQRDVSRHGRIPVLRQEDGRMDFHEQRKQPKIFRADLRSFLEALMTQSPYGRRQQGPAGSATGRAQTPSGRNPRNTCHCRLSPNRNVAEDPPRRTRTASFQMPCGSARTTAPFRTHRCRGTVPPLDNGMELRHSGSGAHGSRALPRSLGVQTVV